MKLKSLLLLLFLILVLGSCKTPAPPPVEKQPEPIAVAPVPPEPDPEPVFEEEPVVNQPIVTQEVYDSTKDDIQKLIETLNGIIRAKNYKAWVTHLSKE